jgi:Tol biopolymer transport system component
MRITQRLTTGIGGLVLLAATVAGQAASPAERLLMEGLMLERAEGRVAEAIVRFERVVADFPNDKDVVPRALYHLGRVYQDRRDPRASVMFMRLVREFPSAELARDAGQRAAALQQIDAGPFRMRTLAFPVSPFPNGRLVHPSPDGRHVLYLRPVRVAGRASQTSGPGAFADIVEEFGPTKLVLHDLQNGRERDLVAQTGEYENVHWSPDSRRILVEYSQWPANITDFADLLVADAPLTRVQIITLATGKVDTPTLPPAQPDLADTTSEAAVRQLIPATYVWSPDGLRVASMAPSPRGRMSEVHLTTIASNQSRAIGRTDGPPEFVWSPDGTRLAFHVTDASNSVDEIRVVTVATGQARSLTVPPATAGTRSQLGAQATYRVKWTKQDELVYRILLPNVGGDVYLVPVSGAPIRKVCEGRAPAGGIGCHFVTADGSAFLRYNATSRRLTWREVATGGDVPLTSSSGDETNPFESPDLSMVGFVSNRDGRRWGIYIAPLGRGTIAQPVRLTWLDGPPSSLQLHGWSPNGRVVLGIGSSHSDVYRLDVDRQSGRPRGVPDRLTQETTDNNRAAMSPDGRRIAYVYRSGTRSGIAVMDASGANERPVLNRAVPDGAALRWLSTDEVVYQKPSAAGEPAGSGLVALNVNSGSERLLPHSQLAERDAWALMPSRNEMLYQKAPAMQAQITARSLTDGAERVIPLANQILAGAFTVSPDGSRIVYATADEAAFTKLQGPATPLSPNEEEKKLLAQALRGPIRFEIRVANVDGTNDRLLLRSDAGLFDLVDFGLFGISPDGRFLLFHPAGTTGMRILDINTGNHWPVFDSPSTDTQWGALTWAVDGSILLRGAADRTEYKVWDGVTQAAVVKAAAGGR